MIADRGGGFLPPRPPSFRSRPCVQLVRLTRVYPVRSAGHPCPAQALGKLAYFLPPTRRGVAGILPAARLRKGRCRSPASARFPRLPKSGSGGASWVGGRGDGGTGGRWDGGTVGRGESDKRRRGDGFPPCGGCGSGSGSACASSGVPVVARVFSALLRPSWWWACVPRLPAQSPPPSLPRLFAAWSRFFLPLRAGARKIARTVTVLCRCCRDRQPPHSGG